ncbi:MAG: ATP-binding protein [Sulfolobales archaeon]
MRLFGDTAGPIRHKEKNRNSRRRSLPSDGAGKAASYVKWMLGVIEYPPGDYENIVAVVATSEGVTRREIGRHRWASPKPMWNMAREGFKRLYDLIPKQQRKDSIKEPWKIPTC